MAVQKAIKVRRRGKTSNHYTIGRRCRPRRKGAGNVGKSLAVFAILEVDREKMRERRKEVQTDDRYHHRGTDAK